MMKKAGTPILLFAATFCICRFYRPFTLIGVERKGLFLATPDFVHQIFSEPFPLVNLVISFLSQFFKFPGAGAAIVAAGVVVAYILVRWILLKIAGRQWAYRYGWGFIFVEIAATAAIAVIVLLNPAGQSREKWEKIEYAACTANWNMLAGTATPELAAEMPETVPYALLAWNEKGQLMDKLPLYPISGNFGLDFGVEKSYRAYLFKAIESRELGCPNEAVHYAFQAGNCLKRGTSFGLMRMVLQQSYARGDSSLVVKYCDVLSRSSLHRNVVSTFRKNPAAERKNDTPSECAAAPVITDDPLVNLYRMHQCGLSSQISAQRFLAYKVTEVK